jgi:hypothetical protein
VIAKLKQQLMKQRKTKGEKIQKYNTEELLQKGNNTENRGRDGQETRNNTPGRGYSERMRLVRKRKVCKKV